MGQSRSSQSRSLVGRADCHLERNASRRNLPASPERYSAGARDLDIRYQYGRREDGQECPVDKENSDSSASDRERADRIRLVFSRAARVPKFAEGEARLAWARHQQEFRMAEK